MTDTLRLVRAPDGTTATDALDGWERGGRVCGITMGQFSLIDLIRAVLDRTGPAHVVLSTWTTGIKDAETARWLADSGSILSLQIITDRSFPSRQPGYAKRLVEMFGEDAIVCCSTHAKFAVVQNDGWSVAIRSSMNLNRNPRFEQFDVDDSPAMAAFFLDFARVVRESMRQGFDFENAAITETFEEALAKMAVGEVTAHHVEPRESTAPPPASSRVSLAEWQLAAAIQDLERYRGEERSGTAVAALHRTVLDLSRDLEAVRAAAERSGEVEGKDTTPEDLRAAVAAASDAEFAVLLEAVEARRAGQRLRVVR